MTATPQPPPGPTPDPWETTVVEAARAWSRGGLLLATAAGVMAGLAAKAGQPLLAGFAALLPVFALLLAFGRTLRKLANARAAAVEAAAPAGPLLTPAPQREARQREAEAEKAELVGRLAGAVAHDVNNTLTVVVAHAEFLAEDAATTEQREAAAQIGEAARHAAALTQQMLVVSRRGLAQPRPLDLSAALRSGAAALRRLLPPSVDLSLDAPEPAWTCIDPTQLHQLVLNLAMNARDAMPEGGALTLAVRTAGDEVTVTVADTGVGMDPATQAAAFQPFFTTKAPGKGTGLGLANVRTIVTALGGRVGLASVPGKGTTFELVFPACPPAEHQSSPRAAAARGSGRVLVVDGDVRIRALASRSLLAAGYDVLDAPDGPTGLRLAGRHRPDLMVADAVIPGLPLGMLVEGYRMVRSDGRVLVTTAFSEDARVQAQVRSGELALLPKPFSRAELQAAVAAVLSGTAPPPRA